MPAFSIKKARECGAISEKELERFGVLFMICQDQIKISSKQWEQAAADFGGTAGSFNFAYRQAIKKLKDKNCYVDGEGGDGGATADAAPAAPAKKGGSKKRKTTAGEEGEVEDSAEKTPKKARGGKKTTIKAEEDVEDA